MKLSVFPYLFLSFITIPLLILAKNDAVPSQQQLLQKHDLCFTENIGQITDQYGNIRDDMRYRLSARGGLNVFIGNGGMHYQFSKPISPDSKTLNPEINNVSLHESIRKQ